MPSACQRCGQRVAHRVQVSAVGPKGTWKTAAGDVRAGLLVDAAGIHIQAADGRAEHCEWATIRTIRRTDGRWTSALDIVGAAGTVSYAHDPRVILRVCSIVRTLLEGDTLGALAESFLGDLLPAPFTLIPALGACGTATLEPGSVVGTAWSVDPVASDSPIRGLYRMLLGKVVIAGAPGRLTQTGEGLEQGRMELSLKGRHGLDCSVKDMPAVMDQMLANLYLHAGTRLENPAGLSGSVATLHSGVAGTLWFTVEPGERVLDLSPTAPRLRAV